MKKLSLLLFVFSVLLGSSISQAASICYNNVCGKIVCPRGCVQKAVNGRCVASYCTGWSAEEHEVEHDHEADVVDDALSSMEEDAVRSCISCNNGCCHRGRSFREAEARCKAHHGSFGCFTRC